MATKLANEEEGSSQTKKNLDGWKFQKISVDQVYKKKIFTNFSSYAVKDFEETITLKAANQNVSAKLLVRDFLKDFIKKQHEFLHLGLVQIAIKPLLRDGLEAPIKVCLRDARHLDFHNSLLALVEANLIQGPFYFNCFPSFSVSLADASSFDALTLNVKTGGIPLALTYRVVCKAMADLSPEALNELVLGETTYFHPTTGTSSVTKWDEFELQAPDSPTRKQQPKAEKCGNSPKKQPVSRVLQKGRSMAIKLAKEEEEGSSHFVTDLDDWKYPKIPIDEVYNSSYNTMLSSEFFLGPSLWSRVKNKLGIFPSYVVKDLEKSFTLKANDQNVSLKFLKGLITKRKEGYVHLGLIQIAIKPLVSDGLGAPVIVCLRDDRVLSFENSLLAVVESNLSQGPLYFNCCPGYSIASQDLDFILLSVTSCRIPLALTYRVVCKVSTSVTFDVREMIRGETAYFQPATGTQSTTKWDQVFPSARLTNNDAG